MRSTYERSQRVLNYEGLFFASLTEQKADVLRALLDKYTVGGIHEMTDPSVFRVAPFSSMGQLPGVAQIFGGVDALRDKIGELQQLIYAEDPVRE